VPDGSGGLVNVLGKDPAASVVVLLAGQETRVIPGLAPATPASQGTFSGGAGLAPPLAPVLQQQQQQQRQQQRQQQQAAAQQEAAEAQGSLAADQAELNRLVQEEAALQQQVLRLA